MALGAAVLGYQTRLNNFRLKYTPAALARVRATKVRILVGGVFANPRFRVGSLTIRDVINEAPSTATFVADTTPPAVGQALRISINSDAPILLFAGAIQNQARTWELKKANEAYPGSGTDDLERLKRRRPWGAWTNVSASTVVAQLVAAFAPGFTAASVAAGLPAVSIILDGREGFDGALQQIAGLIGGYYYIEDGDVHLFVSEATDTPTPIDAAHPCLNDPPIVIDRDLSQVRTRVYGIGHGDDALVDVPIGETIVPIADAVMFNAAGGRALAQWQRLTYTGTQAGGPGSIVGGAVSPIAAPTATPAGGSGLAPGVYQHAYTFATGAGESLPSPRSTVQVGNVLANPSAAPVTGLTNAGTGGPYPFNTGDKERWWSYTWVTAAGETLPSPWHAPIAGNLGPGGPFYCYMGGIAVGPPGTIARRLYRTVANGLGMQLLATLNDNVTTNYEDKKYDYELGAAAPTVNTANVGGTAALSAIATGPAGTTARKLYRTTAGGAQLKLVATIADNATTTYTDAIPDASLGANAPTADTSGLTQVVGQVIAGATTIPTASAAPFIATGGWAIVAGRLIRYTGISGNAITGVPAAGVGAVTQTIRFGEHIDPAPALTGVAGIAQIIPRGTTINLWIQRDDFAAQAAMAALDGGDGIYEYIAEDDRRGEASLIALCDAHLAIYSAPIITARYSTRDVKTKAGKPITITNILGYTGTLTIQSVAIDELDIAPATAPKFAVVASSVRVSLEALLYQLIAQRGASA